MPPSDLRRHVETELAKRTHKMRFEVSADLSELDNMFSDVQAATVEVRKIHFKDRGTSRASLELLKRVGELRSNIRKFADEHQLDKSTNYEPGDLAHRLSLLNKRERHQIFKGAERGSHLTWRHQAPQSMATDQDLLDLSNYRGTIRDIVKGIQAPTGKNVRRRGQFTGFSAKAVVDPEDPTFDLWNRFEVIAEVLGTVIGDGLKDDLSLVEARVGCELVERQGSVTKDRVESVLRGEPEHATSTLRHLGSFSLDAVRHGRASSWEDLTADFEKLFRDSFHHALADNRNPHEVAQSESVLEL